VLAVLRVRLVTTGRRTGLAREIPLYAYEDGDRLVIVGSSAGGPRNPAWVHNLRAQPRATLKQGRTESRVRAREVKTPAERKRLWRLVTGEFPHYETYQRKTERLIPLFVLRILRGG
jgi:deazaflavin-dependent oxidoreductase (nitroreductase family)